VKGASVRRCAARRWAPRILGELTALDDVRVELMMRLAMNVWGPQGRADG
jgi:hypothetical protein